ncbi:hypothetical protein H4Q32_010504 [Labeo rohita]|uniref:Uncharacterized protein n=1 Tax=Labeo rohita TaxID=84645 RepID=A0ABQ8MUV1_LABRO|nr:hypothetical protein H4Q32_010504 [Labeo rohita]
MKNTRNSDLQLEEQRYQVAAGGMLSRGPHHGLCVSCQPDTLPGQLPLLILSSWTKHQHIKTAVRGRSSKEPRHHWEWVLVSCQSLLTVDFVDYDISPTPDPVPIPTSPRSAEHQPEPIEDSEPKPTVREPATSHATEEISVEREEAKEGPNHCTSAEGEQKLELGQMDLVNFDEDIYANMPPFIPPSSELSVYSEPFVCPDLSPLCSPSAHHLYSGFAWVCQFPSASWLEDPSSPTPASESWTRPSDPMAPPRLLAPSSPPSPVGSLAPPCSLVPPAPSWSVGVPSSPQDSTPPAMPRRSVLLALLGSSLPPGSDLGIYVSVT